MRFWTLTRQARSRPVEKITLRKEEEMAPFLKEPMSEGWKSIDELPRVGIFEHL